MSRRAKSVERVSVVTSAKSDSEALEIAGYHQKVESALVVYNNAHSKDNVELLSCKVDQNSCLTFELTAARLSSTRELARTLNEKVGIVAYSSFDFHMKSGLNFTATVPLSDILAPSLKWTSYVLNALLFLFLLYTASSLLG